MSALLGKGWYQKLYICNIGLNSPIFTSVNFSKFNQSYFRGATRVLQRGRICSSHSHERKLNALAGGQLPSGLHKEHRRCVTDQAVSRANQPGASVARMILPIHQRPNGIIHGSFLVDNIIQAATMAANRYGSQQTDNNEEGGHHDATLCFLSSFDYLKYIRPLNLIDASFVKANVTATSDHLLRIEVSVEKNHPFKPDVFKLANSARLSFITDDHHDFSRRYHVVSQKSHTGDSDDGHLSQSIPFKARTRAIPKAPYDCMPPPQHSFCRQGHLCKLMEDQGLILASRLTRHDVVCVHMGPVTFHENIKIGNVMATPGHVVSTAKDVVTVFQTVNLLSFQGNKIQKRCIAEGLFSYVPINSAKERVSIPDHQSFIQDKEVGVEHNIVDSYINALKKF